MTDRSYEQAPQPGTLLIAHRPMRYSDAWTFQQRLHGERLFDRRADTLMLLQHQPVYTLGPRTAPSHIPGGEATLRATGAAVESVTRGGSVTYHGPGQLIGYPILKLSRCASGPKEYVWLLEEALCRTLAFWEIDGYRIDGKPGVFVGRHQERAKIASIGVRIDRGITLHGFALNVDLDLTPFSAIAPCGLVGWPMTSIAALRESTIPMRLVMRQVAERFAQVFNLTWDAASPQISDCGRLRRNMLGMEPPVKEQAADA